MSGESQRNGRRVLGILLGIVAVVLGLFLLIGGFGYPVTYCVSGTGMEETCTTDQVAQLTALALMAGGVVAIGLGGRTVYRRL